MQGVFFLQFIPNVGEDVHTVTLGFLQSAVHFLGIPFATEFGNEFRAFAIRHNHGVCRRVYGLESAPCTFEGLHQQRQWFASFIVFFTIRIQRIITQPIQQWTCCAVFDGIRHFITTLVKIVFKISLHRGRLQNILPSKIAKHAFGMGFACLNIG